MKTTKALLLLLIATLDVVFVSAQYASIDTSKIGDNEKAGRYIKIRGFNMYYEVYGVGEPLLLIHGNGGSISNFMYQVPFFAKNYKVIVADSRAQGKSIDMGDSLSYEMMADDFNSLLDTLHLQSCYIIGWNDGAINGLLLAMRHPGKVKKLAVCGARLSSDTSAIDATAHDWALQYNESFSKLKQTPENKNRHKVAHLLSYAPHITTEQLKKIQCPVLVIGGDNDIVLTKHTLLISEAIPNSYLWIVPGAGNSITIDYKNQFNDVVNNFFRTPYKKITGLDRFN
ncbi:alpha/beta hydrolase [Ginsengibacter hankyongi]|uniref:Alpha/beta hydrolase n=1 Tax=Ginsengibacter hankyongi TaxID=2607284 RepID=A0A5J5IGT7_9BACT|nr:alpha/beta hydrolase [Ginsengibacter hankyongi]KAA9039500.1 alpha/beta hydrolase [Ginsengibacter hankyongi]